MFSLKESLKVMLPFQIIYKVIIGLCLIPVISYLFNLSLKLAGYSYITNRNITGYLQKPTSILILVFIILLVGFFVLMEITVLTMYFGHVFTERRYYFRKLLLLTGREIKRLFRPKNFILILYVLCILPVTQFVIIVSSIFNNIDVSQYFFRQMNLNLGSKFLMFLIVCLLLFLSIYFLFVICYFLLDHMELKEAFKSSFVCMRGKAIKTMGYVILCNISFFLLYILFFVLLVFFVQLVTNIVGEQRLAMSIFLSIFSIANKIAVILLSCLELMAHFALAVGLYYQYTGKHRKLFSLRLRKRYFHRSLPRRVKKILIIGLIGLVGMNSFGIYVLISSSSSLLGEEKTKITSHRGSSKSAPENTLAALRYAVGDMADYAEIDVQETKDGIIVLFHDVNLKRITGVKSNIWSKTYEEIKDLDAGSWFSEEFSEERIPTLDEVIKYSKGKIKLNIELKPNAKNKNLEESVVEIIQANGFENDCVITSFNYKSLTKVKKLNENLKTGYILSAVYGKFYDLEYADFYSMERSFVTPRVVTELHKRKKEIHVWTINKETYIEQLVSMGVDNIITDDPVMARNIIYSENIPTTTLDMLKYIFQ